MDLKALALASGNRKAAMVGLNELTPLTGYVRGGVTALAAKKTFRAYLDESAIALEQLIVSAGQRGILMGLSTQDYLRVTGATLAGLLKVERRHAAGRDAGRQGPP